ncbi:HD-GYP domain-containing protein [Methylobacterium sp. NFXW15]|uniref:HD-GYP domain-containing protein n=1 Tax=Methylobacterium sp. NFXW15 TaxID=2819512 RepID=UPI003CF88233
MREAFVQLVSDRPSERAALARAIGFVTTCRPHAPGDTPHPGRPVFALLDLPPPALANWTRRLDRFTPAVPRIVLARGEGIKPDANTLVLPAGATRESILSRAFVLIEAATRAAEALARRLNERAKAARTLVTDLFDSAAIGGALPPQDIERGTELVLAAVSEAGISAWLAELWQHDAGLYEHTLSVAGLCASFGARIGLSRADLTRLARAGLLHDLGKSRIPKEILDKPGRLDANEMRLMKRHPEIGASLLIAEGGYDAEVIDVVRHHHERLDGTGYPDGLKGSQIADLVRIVSICDVFCALTERRAYRQPAKPAEALAIMVETRGHLDPVLLKAFTPSMLACEPFA